MALLMPAGLATRVLTGRDAQAAVRLTAIAATALMIRIIGMWWCDGSGVVRGQVPRD